MNQTGVGALTFNHSSSVRPPERSVLICTFLLLLTGCSGATSSSGATGFSTTSSNSSCALTPSTLGSSGMQVDPGPSNNTSYLSNLYSVSVFDGHNWQPNYTYKYSRTAKTPWHQNSNPCVNFSSFATSNSSLVKITSLTGAITSISVSPLSLGLTPTVSGSSATFTLSQNNKVWITINGDDADPLFVFADSPKPVVPSNCNLLYFGPGVTTINQYQASSGQTIYLDAGAIVRGNINLTGTSNVQIVGPGILSGDLWTGETVQALPWSQETSYAMITGDLWSTDNATVSGITILDAPFYHFYGGASTVTGIKELSPWYWSTDGFEGVPTVSEVFAFIGDNVFFPGQAGYGGKSFTVSNSFAGTTNNAVFCGGFWGMSNSSSFSYAATMNNIDIKTYTNGTWGTHTPAIFQIWVNNAASTSGYANQTYENIRIEGNLNSNMAELLNMPYPAAWGGTSYNPALGNSYNLTFNNITLQGTQSGLSLIEGLDANDGFHNVTWSNLSINGTAVTGSNSTNYFNVNSYVWGLSF